MQQPHLCFSSFVPLPTFQFYYVDRSPHPWPRGTILLKRSRKVVSFQWLCLDEASNLVLYDSRPRQACTFHGWLVYVSRHIFFRNLLSIASPCASWDFILTLGHEYSIVMGRRKFIRTYPVCSSHPARATDLTPREQLYMGCRWCTLFTVILQFVYIDRSDTIDCQVRNLWFMYRFDGNGELNHS